MKFYPYITNWNKKTFDLLETARPKFIATTEIADPSIKLACRRNGIEEIIFFPKAEPPTTPPQSESGAIETAQRYAGKVIQELNRRAVKVNFVVTPESVGEWDTDFLDAWYVTFYNAIKNHNPQIEPVGGNFCREYYNDGLIEQLPETFKTYSHFMIQINEYTELPTNGYTTIEGKTYFEVVQLVGFENVGWQSAYSGLTKADYIKQLREYKSESAATFVYAVGSEGNPRPFHSLIDATEILTALE